jgi:hypothetical protein
MRRALPARLATLAFAAALLGACGGNGGEERFTKEELITHGDAICSTFARETSQIGSTINGEPSAENIDQYAEAFDQLKPLFDEMLTGLKAFHPPEADQATWDQIISGLEDEQAALAELQSAAAAGDLEALNAAGQKLNDLDVTTAKLATDYGFQQCGS